MSEFTKVKNSLVDKILEQGQRLRNAMVQSILQNDPHSADVLFHHNKKYNTPVSSDTGFTDQPLKDNKLITAFLHGDYLTKQQEEQALNTIRSMSLSDVCDTTEHTLGSKCTCITCTAYNNNNLKCDLRRTNPAVDEAVDKEFLKQVDSLKVVLQSICLNSLGQKKVNQGLSGQISSLNETYFVEYSLPEVFIKNMTKSKSKVDSGLENNYVRVCARRTNDVIYLKQTNIHSVNNLYNCNLKDHNLIFTIRCKKSSHKKSEHLGVANFNFGVFNTSKNASCGKSLPIYLDENSSISVGNIKVTIQLGAGKLYFGQEFLDAVLHKECSLTSSLEEILHDNNKLLKNIAVTKPVSLVGVPICEESKKSDRTIVNSDRDTKSQSASFHHSKERAVKTTLTKEVQVTSLNTPETEVKDTCKFPKDEDKNNFQAELLFGFIYISEAQLLTNPVNSFIKCQPYCQNDTSISRIVYDSSNPLYNFCETIPLLYDDSFLLKLRENFTIVEFWNKSEVTEEVFGLARLPLHQFYLGYRNSVILHHLKRNKLPVIGTDWWEPVYSLDNNELIGQVQVLTALGTDEQIRNLQLERGFKNDVVKSKLTQLSLPKKRNSYTATSNLTAIINPTKPVRSRIFSQLNQPVIDNSKQVNQKVDVGIQSDLKMDSKPSNPPQMMDTLNSFLKLLEASQKPACVENSTNTDPSISAQSSIPQTDNASVQSPQLRKTSDLLDSLHKALNIDTKAPKKVEAPHFRAEVLINSANQLPSRRKLKGKSKKTKRKSGKQEENILPSTYVTFETMAGESLRFTSVFPKSTSPKWNFRCEVELPLDLITNDQKKLIFKVWRKSTNAVLQPNMQTDLVLGFAALDLSVLGLGFPSVQGWFNIIDFSGKCNGQINVHVNPLEKISVTNTTSIKLADCIDQNSEVGLDQADNDECNELLGRALKRKFTELDEITQRLRLRLSAVVSEDSDGSNDDMTDEFENDINNLCVEDDFDLINFEEEARKFNVNYSSQKAEQKCKTQTLGPLSVETQPSTSDQKLLENSSGNVDKTKSSKDSGLLIEQSQSESSSATATSRSILGQRNLVDGKHRIDNLLEKLTLLASETNQPFSSRYVSGCSVLSNEQNDIKDIFQDLEQHSRPNITATSDFDPVMFQQLYGGSTGDSSKSLNGDNKVQSSCDTEGSLSDCRPNPDGQGPGENDTE